MSMNDDFKDIITDVEVTEMLQYLDTEKRMMQVYVQ